MYIYVVDDEKKKYFEDVLPAEPPVEDVILIAAEADEEEDEPVVGIASVSADIGAAYRIEHLYVAPDYRNRGIGSAMVGYIRSILQALGAEAVSASFFKEEESEYITECLASAQFKKSEEKAMNAASMENVKQRIDKFRKKASNFTGVVSLGSISDKQWDECLDEYFLNVSEDAILTGIGDRDYYDGNISMVALGSDGKCKGFLLLSTIDEDVTIDYLWSSDESGITTMALLSSAVDAIKTDGSVIFDARNTAALKLAKKILQDDITELGTVITMVA